MSILNGKVVAKSVVNKFAFDMWVTVLPRSLTRSEQQLAVEEAL